MDAQDRLFGEIAVRLQLLSREQVAACIHEQETDPAAARIGEVACRLGFLSADDMQLVLSHQQAILKRRRENRITMEVAPPPEERSARSQPNMAQVRETAAHRKPTGPQDAAPQAAQPTRAAQPQPAPTRAPSDGDDYDFGAVDTAGSAARLAAHAATQLQDARPAAAEATPSPRPASAATGTLLEAVQAARARRRSFGDEWRNPSAPPPAAPAAHPAAPPAAGTTADHALAPSGPTFRGTVVQNQGVLAAQQAEAARHAAAQLPPPSPPEPPPVAHESASKVPRERPALETGPIADSYLGKALRMAVQQGASDLHVHSGAPIKVRIDGVIRPMSSGGPLAADAAQKVIASVMTDAQWATLAERGEVDFAFSIPDLARFRVNVYRQQRGLDVVFRIIPLTVPRFEDLGLPSRLARLADFRTGMVLFTGPAGSGKSTSLAALIGVLLGSRQDHLLTIENPVEFVFPPGPCLVNQRQVGAHTGSFARALRAALREDPDIIAITELRDRETMELAISAAETGHLVLGTLHTGSAGQTINRIVSSFPADEQEQVRVMLSESLRAVVSQRLVPQATGRGRVPAIELMMVNTAVSNLIREDKTHQLPSVMQTGKAAGMVTMDDSLADLVQSGVITAEQARRYASKKERFGP